MRIVTVVNPRNVSQVRPTQNFNQGCKGDLKDITWFENNPSDLLAYDVVVFQGIIRGSGHLMQYVTKHNRPFVYIDHAYFFSGYNPVSEWMRVSCNGFMPTSYVIRPASRWQQYFNTVKLSPWRKSGKHILVLPPSTGVKWCWPESETWLNETLTLIKQHTDRPIIVREKPDQHIFDQAGNIVGKTSKSSTNIESDLANAHCVVAYNSNTLTNAICKGIPVISHKASPAFFISNKFSDLENLTEPDRMSWLYYMAYNQFNTAEFKSGEAWDILKQSL